MKIFFFCFYFSLACSLFSFLIRVISFEKYVYSQDIIISCTCQIIHRSGALAAPCLVNKNETNVGKKKK